MFENMWISWKSAFHFSGVLKTHPLVFFWKNSFSPCNQITVSFLVQKARKRSTMCLLKGAAACFNHCFYCNVPGLWFLLFVSLEWEQRYLSLIFLRWPLLWETLSTWERWLLVLSHIHATGNLAMSHFRAISRGDSPVFSLRNRTLAHCAAEMFPVYTITYCETICSCNHLTVNLVYSLKYCTRD